jgi:hypothetical protein
MKSAVVASLVGVSLLGVDAGYDEARAIEYANFAGAAYCSKKSLLKWDCGSKCSADVSSLNVCEGKTTKAWLGLWEGKPIVSFEGTHDVASAITDLKVWKTSTPWSQCDNCRVHDGFLKEYNSLKDCVQQTLGSLGFPSGSKIRTTGHSLGAAINSLAMMDLEKEGWKIEESYDFGRPRTGDESFASTWNSQFNGRAWRITHARDPVPQVPPRDLIVNWHFEHGFPEVFYRKSVAKGHVTCSNVADSFENCAEQYRDLALDLLNTADHLDYMGVDTSPLGCKILSEEEVV